MVADLTKPQTSACYLAVALASSFVSPRPGRHIGDWLRRAIASCSTDSTVPIRTTTVAAADVVTWTVGTVVRDMPASVTSTPRNSAVATAVANVSNFDSIWFRLSVARRTNPRVFFSKEFLLCVWCGRPCGLDVCVKMGDEARGSLAERGNRRPGHVPAPPPPPMRNTSRQKTEEKTEDMGVGGGWLDRRRDSRSRKSVGFVSGRGARSGVLLDEQKLGSSFETAVQLGTHAEPEPRDPSHALTQVSAGGLPPSPGHNFFDGLSQVVDFDPPPGARRDYMLPHEYKGSASQRCQREPLSPTGSPRPSTSTWAALRPDDRARALLAMTQYARLGIYRNESRTLVAQAICTAVQQDPKSNPRLLFELDPEGRAVALCQMHVADRADALAGLPYEDRLPTLNHMPAELIGSALAALPAAEVLKIFRGLDPLRRSAVFPELDVSARTAVLAWTASKSRTDLLVKLRPVDRAAALLSLPMKECCSTIRSMSPFHAECVLLEMNSSIRSEVLASIAERDLSVLLSRMPADKQMSVLDGLAPPALHHAFRCIPTAGQALIFDDLAADDRATLVARMTAKERSSLVGSLPTSLQASLLRMLDGKDAALALRSLNKDDAVAVMEELTSIEQAQIISCMSGKDRSAMLTLMEPYQRASIISQTPPEERTWIFRCLSVQDLAKTLSELTPQDNMQALCGIKSSQRAEVLSCMSASERAELALMMPSPVLASTLAEIDPADCKDVLSALPAQNRASVLMATPPALRAALLKSVMPQHRDAPCDGLWQERDGEFLDTVRKLDVEVLQTALEEMSQSDKVALLLHMPGVERARLLERMSSIECADILDSFLLEDRANTVGSLDTSKAALVLAEMHPYKKAILLAAVGERDRASIIGAMATHEVGMVLSALPPADCVSALRALDAKRAAGALGVMAPEERAITMEAVPSKQRAAILSHMEPNEAASCLSRLAVEECASTIRLLEDSTLASILSELHSTPRTAALLACPIKFRVRALSMLSPTALAGFLESLDALDMTATVKNLGFALIEGIMSVLSLDAKVKVMSCIDAPDASRMLEMMAVSEAGRVIVRLHMECSGAVLKAMADDSVYGCLTNMEKRQRDELLANLPEGLQARIRRIITPHDDITPPRSSSDRIRCASHELAQDHESQSQTQSLQNDNARGVASLPLVIPVRRPTPPVSPAVTSPAYTQDSDVAVTVTMRFDEDFEWLTADEQRHQSWSQWLCGIICDAVKASPKRIQVAGLQRGSVCLLLRCLPLSETPGLAQGHKEQRSAMDLALQILAFASHKDVSLRLPKFLGGSLHAVGIDAKSPANALSPKQGADASYCSSVRDLAEESCGVGIAFAPTPDGQYLSVIGMIPGGDADSSGLISVGDLVTTIDGQHVQGIPMAKLAQRIRGPVGSRTQIGFRSRQGGSETNIDLPRIPGVGGRHGNGVLARASPAAAMLSREVTTLTPMQLSFPSDARDKESKHKVVRGTHALPTRAQELYSKGEQGGTAKAASPQQTSPDQGKVLRSIIDKTIGAVSTDCLEESKDKTSKTATPVDKHDIWGTLEELDASIQRRNRDVRSFTESLLQLQACAHRSPDSLDASSSTMTTRLSLAHGKSGSGSSDFFYA